MTAALIGPNYESKVDVLSQQQGMALICEIRQRGVTIIMVEHVMEVVLDLGHVLAQGLPRDIVRNPAVIKAYLGGSTDVA